MGRRNPSRISRQGSREAAGIFKESFELLGIGAEIDALMQGAGL